MVRQVVDEIRGQIARLRNINLIGSALGTLLILALLYWLLSGMVLNPVQALSRAAEAVSRGDLTQALPPRREGKLSLFWRTATRRLGLGSGKETLDEIGQLSCAFGEMLAHQRATLVSVKELAGGLATLMEQTSRLAGTVSSGSATVDKRVGESLDVVSANLSSLKAIAGTAELLHSTADQSASALTEVTASNRTVAEQVAAMSKSAAVAAHTTASMSASAHQTSRNVEELHAFVDQTSTSMAELDASFRTVQKNADDTLQLSAAVRQDAEHHASAVQKTIQGITRIRDASRKGAEVIDKLRTDIAQIGGILNVITDVADQTNLLSLNAAIVAAQAGERGRGFAVVADEIKQLAERTSASTKEIAALVLRIQGLSAEAVASMSENLHSVDIGTELGRETEAGLVRILESTQRSAIMAKGIAAATVEQGRTSGEVVVAVQRIAKNVEELAGAAHEQARGAEQLSGGSAEVSERASKVERAMAEQAAVSRNMMTSTESVHGLAREFRDAQGQQQSGSEKVLAAISAIGEVSRQQSALVSELNDAIARVRRNTETLHAEMARFQI